MAHMLLSVIYLAFISLGLPDSLLGSAWPSMYGQFGVPLSYAGLISVIISFGTILSSLQSERLTKRLGTGRVTALSVGLTALALWGFSVSGSFWRLCLWAIPYGLGAGSVDASLNNYVALHYASRHMSWLHCMWGLGASLGPYVMGFALTGGWSWGMGYRWIALVQICLTAAILCSLPLWKKGEGKGGEAVTPVTLKEVWKTPRVPLGMLTFFCYCALEQSTALWASSYLVLQDRVTTDQAAGYAALFFMGITAGRALGGFLTIKLRDGQMVRLGQGIAAVGILALLLPLGTVTDLAGLALIGLGCAPIYPSLIHATPEHFGQEKSQAVIGVQMASAYAGVCVMPAFFGILAQHVSAGLLPIYLLAILALMVFTHERLAR